MIDRAAEVSILLVDDGELDGVAALLDSEGKAYRRLCGSQIPSQISPPCDLLIVTPRRVERVRRGSPRAAAPGYPLRIIAVEEDSPAMRRRLRRSGLHLLVRLAAESEIWSLLIARALYRGHERREDTRVTVGSPVEVSEADVSDASESGRTILIDLSNRGCRLHTTEPLRVDETLTFTIPESGEDLDAKDDPLVLRGRVRRIVEETGSAGRMAAMTFDEDLPQSVRTRLTSVINRWASGPSSLSAPNRLDAPPIPPCLLPSLPDLTLDDETDPPVKSRSEIRLELEATTRSKQDASPDAERRQEIRGQFASTVTAEGDQGRIVLIGRDLSTNGMRVETTTHLQIGAHFRLALHGPGPSNPLMLNVEVMRDDGDDGFALAFRDVDNDAEREIEKLVACLPDVESLEEGQTDMIGTILSELIPG